MPFVVTAVAAAIAYIAPATAATAFTVGAAAVTYATIIANVIVIGASIAYAAYANSQSRNTQQGQVGVDQGQSVMSRDPLAYWRRVYGTVLASGTIAFMGTTGAKNQDLHVALVMAKHEVQALGDIYFNAGELVPIDAAAHAIGKYAGSFRCDKHLGQAGQVVDPDMQAAFPTLWDSTHVGVNTAWLHLVFSYNTTLYPNGMPTVRCMISGAKVYDPRDGSQSSSDPTTWKYSNNAALCTADYLHDNVWGKAIPWSRIPASYVTEAANTSDETVGLATYATNGVTALTVGSTGDGTYVTAPTVYIEGDGVGASAIATIAGGFVTGYTVTNPGRGYTTATVYLVSNGSGNGATATAAVGAASAGGGTEPRYTINGITTTDQNPDNVLNDMCSAMAGRIVDSGGGYLVQAGAYRTPTAPTFTDDDLVSSFTMQAKASMQDTFNGLKGTFVSPDTQWTASDFISITGRMPATSIVAGNRVTILEPGTTNFTTIGSADNKIGTTFIATGAVGGTGVVDPYQGQDGGRRRWKDVSYSFITSSATAQRVSKIELERGRQQITCSGTYKLKAFQVQPGDTVKLTRPSLGWTDKLFEVVDWTFQPATGKDSTDITLAININFKETDPSVWDWTDGQETTVDIAPNSTLPDPSKVGTPVALALLADGTTALIQQDGTVVPRLQVTWNSPNDIYVEQGGKIRIEYKKHTDSTWLVWSEPRGDVLLDYITDVQSGIAYDVRVQFQNAIGSRGKYAEVDSYTVGTVSAAPANVGTVTATSNQGKQITVSFAMLPDPKVAYYNVYRSTSATDPSPTFLNPSYGNSFIDDTVAYGVTYYYYVKALTRLGAPSAAFSVSNGASASPSTLVNTTPASAQSAPTLSTSVTYRASDGTLAARATLSVSGLTTGSYGQSLCSRLSSVGAGWTEGPQNESVGFSSMDYIGLLAGQIYDFMVREFNEAGISTDGAVLANQTMASSTNTPSAPTGGSVSGNAPAYAVSGDYWAGFTASWTGTPDPDFDHWELFASQSASSAGSASSYIAPNNPQGAVFPSPAVSIWTSRTTSISLYSAGPASAAYCYARQVNTSKVASAWVYIGEGNSVAVVGAKTMAQQPQNGARVSAANLAPTSATAPKTINVLAPDTGVVVISPGGVNYQTFTIDLTGCGFSAKPKSMHLTLNSTPVPDSVYFIYVYDDVSNTSTSAVCQIHTLDPSLNLTNGAVYRYAWTANA